MYDDHAWVVPRIRAALDAGVPPTAIILRDPGRKEYGAWDLKLAAALHVYDGLMRGNVPVYWDESDRVRFEVETHVSKSQAAVELKQEAQSKKKARPGAYYVPVPKVTDGGALPTLEEWLAEREAKRGKLKEPPPHSR